MKKYLLSLLFTANVVFAFAQGTISTLICTTPVNAGTLTRGVAASGVNSTVTYTGGDGGAQSGQTVASTGVLGLTATLAAGNFAVGNGSLLYSITGTPATSGTASFALSIGGKICTLTRTVAQPAGTITSLTCSTATNNGVLISGLVASGVSSGVPYTGGNGGTFALQSVASTGVTGLTATRSAATLVSGSGSFTYNIAGTPTSSGTANFAISFGGQSCTLSRTVIPQGTITALTCSSATNAGTLFASQPASSVSFSVPYSGGNGGGYQARSVTSTGVTGLTASLAAGVFASGSGNLTFTISGTPSTFGTASFALNIGGQSCTVAVPVLGSIGALACASASRTGTLASGVAASGVSSSIPYSGGTGGPHNGQTVNSTVVTGLTATLSPANFLVGAGNVVYTISGTPASGGTARFALSIGGRSCELTFSVPGAITALNCNLATNNGTLTSGVVASGVSSIVPYTGGNGGTYTAQNVSSTGVTGLTASVVAGTFANGAGNLTYNITGTPARGGTASFALNIGGRTCTLTRIIPGTITALNCSTATNSGILTSAVAASGVSSSVPYTGGNSGPHDGQLNVPSTGVTGLFATLSAASFLSGAGSLIYNITGTPSDSGRASFALSIGGQSCILTRSVVLLGTITSLNCGSATPNGTLTSGVAASGVSSVVPYTGGNGGSYTAQSVSSTGVNGLTANLVAGTFVNGSGNLTITITGTPSSGGTASFALNIGGQTCTLTRTIPGTIGAIACASATPTGLLYCSVPAGVVTSSIPYSGGNGGPHNGQTVTSTGVTGLTATLPAGNFLVGTGNVVYTITGTPATTGTATFAINIGGKPCSLTRAVTGGITTLNCSSATNNGNLITGLAASGISSIVPYTGGCAGSQPGQPNVPSTGVTGLFATLAAGNFASGSGTVTYTITGTPVGTGTASFALNIGGRTCTLTRTVTTGTITGLTCTSASTNGTLTAGVAAAAGVTSIVPFTGGNGGTHNGQTVTSTGVTGLTATLNAGSFPSGAGNLTYTITGTPTTSGTASFALNIGGRTCTINRTVSVAPPTVSTTAATFVTTITAVSGGNVSFDGGSSVTARGICWSTAQNPTVALATKTSNGTGTGSFSSSMTGLSTGTLYYVRAYATNSAGTAYGTQLSFTTVAGSVTDIDGNVYHTVTIGNQVWMKANLKVSRYRNGTAIPSGLTNAAWTATSSGATALFNNDVTNDSKYGKLYNWYAVVNPAGLCPTGWRMPMKREWNVLTKFLDPAFDTSLVGGGNPNVAGGKLKQAGTVQIGNSLWFAPNTDASNSSQFTGLPGGLRNETGNYFHLGVRGHWWSSSQHNSTFSWYSALYYTSATIDRTIVDKRMGLSVRCISETASGMSAGREAVSSEFEGPASDEIQLFPNPANSEVSIEISSAQESHCRIEITDMMGRTMLQESRLLTNGLNVLSFDIRNFSNGVYLVYVGKDGNRKVHRLVKN